MRRPGLVGDLFLFGSLMGIAAMAVLWGYLNHAPQNRQEKTVSPPAANEDSTINTYNYYTSPQNPAPNPETDAKLMPI